MSATNPLLAAIAPIFTGGLADLKAELAAIIANPTVETVTTAGEKLALDTLNPANLNANVIGGLAQEALNLVNTVEAHFATAAAAPTAVAPAASN